MMNEAQPGRLIATIGLPCSGKTTWAQGQGHPVVCPDAIRYALHGTRFIPIAEPFVWAIAHCMVNALFLAGHRTVILDSTNVTAKRRDEWKRYPGLEWYIVYTPPSVCRERALLLDDKEILPIIDRMAAEWDMPKPETWT